MNYFIKYSKRKTLSIKICQPGGEILVSAPNGMPKKRIESFLLQKKDWIEKTVAKVTKNSQCASDFALTDGGKVMYLGQQYFVKINSTSPSCTLDGDSICLPAENPSECLERFYRAKLKLILKALIEKYTKLMQRSPVQIAITSARSRWGSCSSKRHLSFTFRLAMAPEKVIEYVVVHEMAHMFEMNHSSRFYAVVKSYYGDYSEAVKWLKSHGALLYLL